MTQPVQTTADTSAMSTTNFDLPSLYLLTKEIDVALKDAENHLSEFNDDEEQAPLLLDSVDVLRQLTSVLNLISLQGGSDLALALADALQQLYDEGENTNSELIMDISEGIMTLDRYIEFVLLKETLEPSLLIPIINKLYTHLGKSEIDTNQFAQHNQASISIANPEQNYQSLTQLNLNIPQLSSAYRAGLGVVLTNTDGQVDDAQTRKLNAMTAACRMIANHSDTLFWQAAAAAVTDIDQVLPLSNAKKRILVFLEQQFHDYLPVSDKRFADLVSFACQRDHALAKDIQSKYAINSLDAEQKEQMRRHLFGPNHEVTDTLNDLIQEQINNIKEKVDNMARGDSSNSAATDAASIAAELSSLSSVMQLLNIEDAAQALRQEASAVTQWQTPTPENYDQLLSALMIAENSSIFMAKMHTPGAVKLPLHNRNISLHQIDTAYDVLIQESRSSISTIEQAINDYIADDSHDPLNIQNIPAMLHQVSGAIYFLNLTDAANMLSRLATFMDDTLLQVNGQIGNEVFAKVADVIMAVDYHLEGLENNHPVGEQTMSIGHHSLNKLMAA